MTNVAIAMPRSPMHLANAAWDLQLMTGGRFRLGLGSQIKPHIEKRYGATWSPPAARMREIVLAVKAILTSWQDGTRLDFRGEYTQHTLMPPTFVPGPNPFGASAGAARRARAGDDPDRGRGRRRAAGDAVPQPPARPRAHPARGGRGAGPRRPCRGVDFAIYPQAILAMGRTADELEAATLGVRGLLAFYGSTPAYRPVLDIEGWGDLQPELNALSKTGDIMAMIDLVTDEMVDTLAVRGTPEECAAELTAASATSPTGSAATSPATTAALAHIRRLAAALSRVEFPTLESGERVWTRDRKCRLKGQQVPTRRARATRSTWAGSDAVGIRWTSSQPMSAKRWSTSRSSASVPAKPVVGAIASTKSTGSQFM